MLLLNKQINRKTRLSDRFKMMLIAKCLVAPCNLIFSNVMSYVAQQNLDPEVVCAINASEKMYYEW